MLRTAVGLLIVCAAFAQTAAFEVASVRRVDWSPRMGGMQRETTPDSLTMRHVSAGFCIRWAYGVQPYEIIGPAWIDPPTDFHYDIVAKAASPVTDDRLKLMLRTLLADRFKLAVHREKRDLPVYLLTVAINGHKLHPADPLEKSGNKPAGGPFHDRFENISMPRFAEGLSSPWNSRPVLDRTGLDGGFDFTWDLAPYLIDPATGKPILDARGAVDMEDAVLRALPDQLGLRLEPAKAPVEVLVIDRLEKLPTPN